MEFKEKTGATIGMDPESIPDNEAEAEIFIGENVKSDAEIAAQIATDMTLSWNSFDDNVFRRCVNDLATNGIAVVKRSNDPNYGIKTHYVEPKDFIHSETNDPSFEDITYGGHVRTMPIQELKRIASGELEEEDFKKIAKKTSGKTSGSFTYDDKLGRNIYDYDEYSVEVLEFEFLSTDCMHFEEKRKSVWQ